MYFVLYVFSSNSYSKFWNFTILVDYRYIKLPINFHDQIYLFRIIFFLFYFNLTSSIIINIIVEWSVNKFTKVMKHEFSFQVNNTNEQLYISISLRDSINIVTIRYQDFDFTKIYRLWTKDIGYRDFIII